MFYGGLRISTFGRSPFTWRVKLNKDWFWLFPVGFKGDWFVNKEKDLKSCRFRCSFEFQWLCFYVEWVCKVNQPVRKKINT